MSRRKLHVMALLVALALSLGIPLGLMVIALTGKT